MTFVQRSRQVWNSFRSLPAWVQFWVSLILVPVNLAPLFFLDTWTGKAAAAAFLLVGATNIPIMFWAGGMTRLMSLPHLLTWIPLEIGIVLRQMGEVGGEQAGSTEVWLGLLLMSVNGISLVFDTLDSIRWLRGEREVPGVVAL